LMYFIGTSAQREEEFARNRSEIYISRLIKTFVCKIDEIAVHNSHFTSFFSEFCERTQTLNHTF
jgi:hypothetical protein